MNNKPNESPTTKEVNDEFDIPFDELKDLQWIGNGAQGCVFKGHFRNEEVAIKKVKSKEEASIKNLKKLNHPNLVKFKGASFNGDQFYCIVMEFCPFGQLYTFLNSKKENFYLKPALMIDWSKQIASGMQHLHLNKIIHRDLKSPK
jgi:mitogen-activated protein kinase kinase kinase 13